MSCDLAAGRAFPCKDAIGSIVEVLFSKASATTYSAINTGVTTITTDPLVLYRYELTRNSGSFQQTVTSSVENGTVFYEQVLTIQFPKIEAGVNDEIFDLLKNRLAITVRDTNDNFHVMGYEYGAEVTGGTIGTGTAKGDLNGYNLVFTAQEKQPAPFNDNLVTGAPSGVTISPAY